MPNKAVLVKSMTRQIDSMLSFAAPRPSGYLGGALWCNPIKARLRVFFVVGMTWLSAVIGSACTRCEHPRPVVVVNPAEQAALWAESVRGKTNDASPRESEGGQKTDTAHTPEIVATIHYSAWLADADRPFFDTNVKGEPFSFSLGRGRVVAGLDAMVSGMEIGESRREVVPPELAYGRQGFSDLVPPNAVVIFEVELIDLVEIDTLP